MPAIEPGGIDAAVLQAIDAAVPEAVSSRPAGVPNLPAEIARIIREGGDLPAIILQLHRTPAVPPFDSRERTGERIGEWTGRRATTVQALEQKAFRRDGPRFVMFEGRSCYKAEWTLAWLLGKVRATAEVIQLAAAAAEPATAPEPAKPARARKVPVDAAAA